MKLIRSFLIALVVMMPLGALAQAPGGNGTSQFGAIAPVRGNALGIKVGTLLQPWGGILTGSINSAAVAIVDASGAQITNFGGGGSSQYPTGSVPITISATGTTGATTATLAANATLKTYICWFSIRANATAAATANSTVTGTVTGTLNFTQWTAPLASGLGITEMIFNPCIPSSAINTAIAIISAAPGTGGVVSVSAGGYQL